MFTLEFYDISIIIRLPNGPLYTTRNHTLVLGGPGEITLQGFCEGNTEMRPLIYRDSLRHGEPNRCDTLTQW